MPAKPAVFEADVLEASRALAADGRSVNGFSLRRAIGRGDPNRLAALWETARQAQAEAPASTDQAPVVLPPAVSDLATDARDAVAARVGEMAGQLWAMAERVAVERARGEAESARAETAELRRALDEASTAVAEADAAADEARERADQAEVNAAERVSAAEQSAAAAKAEAAAEVERVRVDLRSALDAIGRLKPLEAPAKGKAAAA